MSEGQTWNSEDIRLYSFTVLFWFLASRCHGSWLHKQSTDVCWPVRGSNPLASLWKVCSSLLAATATAEFGLNQRTLGSRSSRLRCTPWGGCFYLNAN